MSVIFNPAAVAGGSGITQLTGDVTAGPGTGSQVATLATVNANVGTWGDATHVGQFTVNAKGLVTAAGNVAISGAGGGMTIGGAIVGGTTPAVLFIGPGNVLAQDPTNFGWDDTHDALMIQGQNAVFRVPNASGDNWFEGGAGNFTVTGFNNFGTGPGALASVTTGQNNVGLGQNALANLTIATGNFAVGTSALLSNIDGSNNTAVGIQALLNLNVGGGGSGNNVALGLQAGRDCSGEANIFIGTQAGLTLVNGNGNVFIGRQTGSSLTGVSASSNNVIIGGSAFDNAISGLNNTMVGIRVGQNLTGGNYNTIVGQWFGPSASVSRMIALADGTTANLNFDYNYTKAQVWSFNYDQYWGNPVGIHVYNSQDASPPTNYERGVFDWNVTSNILTVGVPPSGAGGSGTLRDVRLYTAGIPSLFRIPNASGDNWFSQGAGNFTVTGYQNFGDGANALAAVTTGFVNTAFGDGAMAHLTTGSGNFACGTDAAANMATGSGNVAVGYSALRNGFTMANCVAIGESALTQLDTGSTGEASTIAIGFHAMSSAPTGTQTVCIGSVAAKSLSDSNVSVYVGDSVLKNATGSSMNLNTLIGPSAGDTLTHCTTSTILGAWSGPAASVSSIIAITDGLTGIFGSFTQPNLDWNFLTSQVWSFKRGTNAQGLHIYNTFDDAFPTVNFERACLDWNLTSSVFRLASQAGGTGTIRLIAIDGFSKAGAPANTDLPSGTWALIDDTSGNQTWLVFNKGGTIRKVQLV